MTKAYKVFNPDWTCRGFVYEVGMSYRHEGKVIPCEAGFHACPQPVDCFSYYSFDPRNKVAEVELSGHIVEKGDKLCASDIRIVRELPWHEVLSLCNSGKGNSGYGNSGNKNSGDWNSGDGNSGNWNSGYGNSGSGCTGAFCTKAPPFYMFDKPIDKPLDEIAHPTLREYSLTIFVSISEMTDEEKVANPTAEDSGGYLKELSYHEMWRSGWAKDDDENKKRFFHLPNFDLEIFEEITGIDATKDYKRLIG